jgi:hypothetical protein
MNTLANIGSLKIKLGRLTKRSLDSSRKPIKRVRRSLSTHRNVLDDLPRFVSKKEVLQGEELKKMLGKTPAE